MGFFLKISFWFIEMLRSEAEVIKKFFVIELSVSSLVYSAWTRGKLIKMNWQKYLRKFQFQRINFWECRYSEIIGNFALLI